MPAQDSSGRWPLGDTVLPRVAGIGGNDVTSGGTGDGAADDI